MSIFVLLIEIIAGGLLGLGAALLCAPWRLRGMFHVGPALRWDLTLRGAFGLVRARVGSGKAANGDDGDRETGGAGVPDRGPVIEFRLAGIPVWRRGGDRGRTDGRPRRGRRRIRKASGSAREENGAGGAGRKRSKRRFRLRAWLRILDREWRREWLRLALLVLRRLFRTVRLRMAVQGTYAAPDPAVTGWLAAASSVLGTTGNGTFLLDVKPDFTAQAPDLDIAVETRMVPLAVLATMLLLLAEKPVWKQIGAFIRAWLKRKSAPVRNTT